MTGTQHAGSLDIKFFKQYHYKNDAGNFAHIYLIEIYLILIFVISWRHLPDEIHNFLTVSIYERVLRTNIPLSLPCKSLEFGGDAAFDLCEFLISPGVPQLVEHHKCHHEQLQSGGRQKDGGREGWLSANSFFGQHTLYDVITAKGLN